MGSPTNLPESAPFATLQEFKFMGQSRSPSVSPSKQATSLVQADTTLFEQYLQGGNPFEMQIDSKEDETDDVLGSNGVWAIPPASA